jgi:hypothetical protein
MQPLHTPNLPPRLPVVADKVTDLRDKLRDAFTGWLEIEQAA